MRYIFIERTERKRNGTKDGSDKKKGRREGKELFFKNSVSHYLIS